MRNPIDPKTGLPIPSRTDRAPRDKRQGRVPGPGAIDQVNVQVLRDPGLHATPEDFGAGVGAADFSLAAAGVVKAFADKRREAEDDTAAIAGLSEARVRFTRVARSMEAQATTAEGLTGNLDRALGQETDAILRDLREVRGLRPSKGGEAAIRRRLGVLASRMVVRGAMSEHRIRLAKLGRDVDASVAEAALAAFNNPGDFPAIIAETEARLARFKDKLPPDILAAKAAAAKETIAQNTVAGLIELDPALAIRGLKEGVFDDHLPAAERKRLRARAKAAVSDRRAQAERGQSRERAAAGADGARRLVVLEGAIGRGEAGEQAIAEAADILDEPTRARLHEKLKARRADDAARNRRIEKVSAVLAGRTPATGEGNGKPDGGGVKDEDLRPGAPGWPQAVDDHYASLADALETMDPDGRARFEDDYARATGVLPGAIAKTLRGGLLSDDPAGQAAAATHLVRLKDVDPGLISAIPADERRRAAAIAEFADLGLPPARAVELAEEKLAQRVLPSKNLVAGKGRADGDKIIEVGSGSFTLTPEAEERARTRLDALVREDTPRPSEEEARNMLILMARDPELRKKHRGKLSGIYAAVPDDSAFTREDTKRRDVLQESIARDHALREQSSRWIDLDRHQRETFVRNLVNKTVTAYGMTDNPPKVEFKPLKETGIGAKYDPTTDTITVNTASPQYKHGKSLGGNIAGTAVHEAIHAYQQRLAKRVADGTIKSGDPNCRQGQLFLLNKAEGMALRPNFQTLEGLRAYVAQPVERHARGVVEKIKALFDFQN